MIGMIGVRTSENKGGIERYLTYTDKPVIRPVLESQNIDFGLRLRRHNSAFATILFSTKRQLEENFRSLGKHGPLPLWGG